MCGITGWFSPEEIKQEDEANLQKMMHVIAHRGPDGQGSIITEHAALGHVRLAIIDLQNGRQPISLNKQYQIVFNGEIYNYKELRSNLMQKGHQFYSQSDTEVILALYVYYGMEAFSLLRGMFAIAIWDAAKQCALLVRDTIGIKPLFYNHLSNGELIFGSEAKAILVKQGQAQLNENALHLLMNFRYLPGQFSLFKNIQQLAPGSILQWFPHKQPKIHHFQFKQPEPAPIFDVFKSSCQLHLTADVEVGAYLSGGIDSASIAALAIHNSAQPLRTFTLNIGDDPDEAKNAQRTAQILGINNIQGDIEYNLDKQLPNLVWHLELPKINALQTFCVSQLAAQHVKVVLSGLGGDELFLGYNAHKIIYHMDCLNTLMPNILSRSLSGILQRSLSSSPLPMWSEPERAILMLGALGDWPRVYGLLRNVWDNPKLRQQIYGSRMLDADLDDAFKVIRQHWPKQNDPVKAMAGFEWQNKMVNDLLWQEDRCSMAVGLEVRVPFLDPVLANAIQPLSRQILMPKGIPKAYMRSMLRTVLPQEILHRPKSGFQVDASHFFNQYLKHMADEWLSPEKIREVQLFNPDFVQRVRNYPTGKSVRWHYFMLYLMLMTHLWIDVFEQGNRP